MFFSLPHLKVSVVHPVKGVKLLWQKVCFTLDIEFPKISGLRGSEQEHFSDYFNHCYSAGGLFHSLVIKGSQMVHQCWC